MIKQLEMTNELASRIEDSDVLDTIYDELLTKEIYKKYPIAKQLAVLNKDKADPRRVAYEQYVKECKQTIATLLAKWLGNG